MSPTRTVTDSDVVAELKSGVKTQALTFSANGECVVSGDGKNVRVWRVSDGKQIKKLAAGPVNCLAVSRDGRWITAGMLSGNVIVWDAQHRRYRKAFSLRNHYVVALDFSPDSRQLLTACFDCTTTILDVAKHKHMITLHHDDEITAAKYSQQGDRFAVATRNFIRIYNRDNFNLSSVIRDKVTPWYNTGLLWSSDQLFIISESRIKQINTTTGSVASEWPVPDSVDSSCIALHQHGESIVYSTDDSASIWGTSIEHRRLDLIQHPQRIHSIAISPDYQYLAIGERGKIIIRRLSCDPIQRDRTSSINPADIRLEIHRMIQDVIRDTPHVLIDTDSGRLVDKSRRAEWFESLPIFHELVTSMTTTRGINIARIEEEVATYYRYATLSHTWEGDEEPTFQKVTHIAVYDLEASTTHDKLKTFCKIVRQAGLRWAWSDTCCIDKMNSVVLQEALVRMFKWYEGSSLTIIFLRGVRSPGDLAGSVWNTRAWTFQEYHASKVVRFYNEDWRPYLDLDIPNHKESPEVISEMEKATGISAHALMALRPGLNKIREKLCVASRRETTKVEDEAYSLLGIFNQSLHITYGEEDKALGQLLSGLLTSSGDTSILAWTGKSGSFNSCLPASISVFQHFPPPHIPPVIDDVKLEAMTSKIRDSTDLGLVMRLHDKLLELPVTVPSFSDRRMRLPCFAFSLGPVALLSSTTSVHVFGAMTDALGAVTITTAEDLSQLNSLTLVHPWIDFLLDRRAIESIPETITGVRRRHRSSSVYTSLTTSSTSYTGSSSRTPQLDVQFQDTSLSLPIPKSPKDRETSALRLVARLRQSFGALLLTPVRHNVDEYRRVAADSEIIVQVKEETPLEMLRDSIRTLGVHDGY